VLFTDISYLETQIYFLSYLESQLNALPDSVIGLWLQKQKMVKRVCHRVSKEKVHTGKNKYCFPYQLMPVMGLD